MIGLDGDAALAVREWREHLETVLPSDNGGTEYELATRMHQLLEVAELFDVRTVLPLLRVAKATFGADQRAFAGDILLFSPLASFWHTLPPEWKALVDK